MNDTGRTCRICGEAAVPRAWLACMLCGRRYHFALDGLSLHKDCGIAAPNPKSSGC